MGLCRSGGALMVLEPRLCSKCKLKLVSDVMVFLNGILVYSISEIVYCSTCRHVKSTTMYISPERILCLMSKKERIWFLSSNAMLAASFTAHGLSNAFQASVAALLPLGVLAASAIAARSLLRRRVRHLQKGSYHSVPQQDCASAATMRQTAVYDAASESVANHLHQRRARLSSLVKSELGIPSGRSAPTAPPMGGLTSGLAHQLGAASGRGSRGSVSSAVGGHGWLAEEPAVHQSEPFSDPATGDAVASRVWGLQSRSLQLLPDELEVRWLLPG